MKGVYLECDPYSGWSVVAFDEYGNKTPLIQGAPTLEDAMRQAVINTGQPHYLKLFPSDGSASLPILGPTIFRSNPKE